MDTGSFAIKYKAGAKIIKTTTIIDSLTAIDQTTWTYTFKSDAAEIAALKVDDVILLPALLVGKVVSVVSGTDDVVLRLTPVPITEIVTDLDSSWRKTIDFSAAKVNSASSALVGQKRSALDLNDVNEVVGLLTGINPAEYLEAGQQIVSGAQWLANVLDTGVISLSGGEGGWQYTIELTPSGNQSMAAALAFKHAELNAAVTYNGMIGADFGFDSRLLIVEGEVHEAAYGTTRVAARGVIKAVAAASGTHQLIFTSPTIVKIVGLIGLIPIVIDVKIRVRIISEMLGEASANLEFDTWLDVEAGLEYAPPASFNATSQVNVAQVDVIDFAVAGPFGAALSVGLETPHMTVSLGGSVLVSELWMGPGIIGGFTFAPACLKAQALIQAFGSYDLGVLGQSLSSGSQQIENRGETFFKPGSQCPDAP